ncbi:MAG: phosphate ABC transporter substrate-binding protein [Anaerovoracaceae bacterium]|jgi:phosphate transport system substrate-binding protein
MKKAGKVITIALTLCLGILVFAGCGSNGSSDSGSSGGGDLSGTVSTNGSTSMESVIGGLSEQFMKDNPDVKVTYDATGSGTGIESVSNGSCDIGLSSRALKDEEKDKGLEEKTIALDGIAIIVNSSNKLTDIKMDDIKSIYTGDKTKWDDGGKIVCIGRESGSGTRDGFETITETEGKCKLEQELTSTGAVIEAVKGNKNAIGYASYADVKGKDGVTILKVDGVELTPDHISDGTYKIQRPFNLITKKDSELSEEAQAFYDYAASKDASSLIEDAGAVPTAE